MAAEDILKKGSVDVRIKVGGRMQVHELTVVWDSTPMGKVPYLESRFPIPPMELIRLAQELQLPVRSRGSAAFPKGKAAKDFAVDEVPETEEEEDDEEVAEEDALPEEGEVEEEQEHDGIAAENEEPEKEEQKETELDSETKEQIDAVEREMAAMRAADEADKELAEETEKKKKKQGPFDDLLSMTESLIKK